MIPSSHSPDSNVNEKNKSADLCHGFFVIKQCLEHLELSLVASRVRPVRGCIGIRRVKSDCGAMTKVIGIWKCILLCEKIPWIECWPPPVSGLVAVCRHGPATGEGEDIRRWRFHWRSERARNRKCTRRLYRGPSRRFLDPEQILKQTEGSYGLAGGHLVREGTGSPWLQHIHRAQR